MKQWRLFAIACLLFASSAQAQELKLPALSPGCKIIQDFSTSTIEISYSRPSMRNRTIFGDLVAYGEVWRTGANSATKIKFGEDVLLDNQAVKAGEYALYTIPGEKQWEVILNKGTSNWGASGYDKNDDVLRMTVKPKEIDKTVQTFTINITNISLNSCNIELSWENTRVVIPVKANNEERLASSIDKAINNPSIPYYPAATYYYETGQNLDKALEYTAKAVEQNPKAFWIWYLRARIAAKMGRRDIAKEAAEKSAEAAKGSSYEAEYERNANRLIKSLAKK